MVHSSFFRITSSITSPSSIPCLKSEPVHLSRSIHHSPSLQWRLRDENRLPQSEIVDRIYRLATLQRFHAIPNLSFRFSSRILNLLLHRLRSNPSASLGLFTLFSRQQKFKPSPRSYCRLIPILHQAGMLQQARIYTRQLLNLCKSRTSFDRAWSGIDEFNQEIPISRSVFDMILEECAEKGMRNHALYVFDYMSVHGPKPNNRSCNCFLRILVRDGEMDNAFCLFYRMNRIGVFPDASTCSIMVDAFCKRKEFGRAEEFVKKMENMMSVDVNVDACNCLIDGYFSIGDVNSAEGVTHMMVERGITSDVVTCTCLIKGYAKLGHMEKAERVLGYVLKSYSTIDEHVYGLMVDGVCRNAKMDN